MGKGGVTHGLKYQARSLVAVSASDQHSRWLAGTNALREENVVGSKAGWLCSLFQYLVAEPVVIVQIQLLEFNPETDSIKVLASYLHGQEVWHLAPHPQDVQTLATISNQGQSYIRSVQCQ